MRITHWVAALALAVPTAVIAAPATAVTATATLDVNVYNETNCCASLPGATVALYSASTGGQVGSSATTDGSGHVDFAVPAGTYTAKVSKAGFVTEYSTMTTVTADDVENEDSEGTDVGLNVTPAQFGKAHGQVTTNGSGFDWNGYGYVDAYDVTSGNQVARSYTYQSGDGKWGLKLAPGSYKFALQMYSYDFGTYTTVWAGGADQGSAASFTVAAAGDLTIPTFDVTRADPIRIAGKVTDATGKGLAGVSAYLLTSTTTWKWSYVSQATTDASGAYAFTGNFATGDYRIWFSDNAGEYLDGFYGGTAVPVADPGDSTVPAGATTVSLSNTRLNVTAVKLVPATGVAPQTSGIKGVVTDDLGNPLFNARIELTNTDTQNEEAAYSGRNGSWHIDGEQLPPGTYSVRAYADDNGYEEVTGLTLTIPVQGVGNGGTIKIARQGSIGGRLTHVGHADEPYTGGDVHVYDANGDEVDDEWTNDDGTYEFTDLTPGAYFLKVEDASSYDLYDNWHDLIPTFFGGKPSLEGATPVTVTRGVRTTVNITLTSQLTATGGTAIAGTAAAGSTLTAQPGTWSRKTGTSFSYVWTIGSKVVSTSGSYKVALTDAKKAITLTVTATNPKWEAGSTSTATSVAKLTKKQAKQLKKQQKKAKDKKHKGKSKKKNKKK